MSQKKKSKIAEEIAACARMAVARNYFLSSDFEADTQLVSLRKTTQSALMEAFIVKWFILFSNSKNDKHRIWQFEEISDKFERKLTAENRYEKFLEYNKNVAIVRNAVIAHIDNEDKIKEVAQAGAHYPNLAEGCEYLCVLYNIVEDKETAKDDFELMNILAADINIKGRNYDFNKLVS